MSELTLEEKQERASRRLCSFIAAVSKRLTGEQVDQCMHEIEGGFSGEFGTETKGRARNILAGYHFGLMIEWMASERQQLDHKRAEDAERKLQQLVDDIGAFRYDVSNFSKAIERTGLKPR